MSLPWIEASSRVTFVTRNPVRPIVPKWNPIFFSTENMDPQHFSMPRLTMLYMIKQHKTLALHQKFMKLCKYAYDKNRIVPVWHLDYRKNGQPTRSWSGQWDEADFGFCNREKVDIVNGNYKIWVLNSWYLGDLCQPQLPHLISTLIAKAYRIDSDISIVGQSLTWEEFLFLATGKREKMSLSYGGILNADGTGSPALIGGILACLPEVERIDYQFLNPKNIDNGIIKKEVDVILSCLSVSTGIRHFEICGLTDEFDIDSIETVLMKISDTRIKLFYNGELAPDYKENLERIVLHIVEKYPRRTILNHKGPGIFFHGQNRDNFFEMF